MLFPIGMIVVMTADKIRWLTLSHQLWDHWHSKIRYRCHLCVSMIIADSSFFLPLMITASSLNLPYDHAIPPSICSNTPYATLPHRHVCCNPRVQRMSSCPSCPYNCSTPTRLKEPCSLLFLNTSAATLTWTLSSCIADFVLVRKDILSRHPLIGWYTFVLTLSTPLDYSANPKTLRTETAPKWQAGVDELAVKSIWWRAGHTSSAPAKLRLMQKSGSASVARFKAPGDFLSRVNPQSSGQWCRHCLPRPPGQSHKRLYDIYWVSVFRSRAHASAL